MSLIGVRNRVGELPPLSTVVYSTVRNDYVRMQFNAISNELNKLLVGRIASSGSIDYRSWNVTLVEKHRKFLGPAVPRQDGIRS